MTDDLQEYVNQKIESGQFENAEELAAEAIRVYRKIENEYEQFRADIQERIAMADAGQIISLDGEKIKQRLAQELNSDG